MAVNDVAWHSSAWDIEWCEDAASISCPCARSSLLSLLLFCFSLSSVSLLFCFSFSFSQLLLPGRRMTPSCPPFEVGLSRRILGSWGGSANMTAILGCPPASRPARRKWVDVGFWAEGERPCQTATASGHGQITAQTIVPSRRRDSC